MTITALDTETEAGQPWTVQLAHTPDYADVYLCSDNAGMAWCRTITHDHNILTVVHNGLFDLGVLYKLGIYPAHVTDTMVMAYLLGELSLKLKVLVYRHCGMVLKSYADVVRSAGTVKAEKYLHMVAGREWEPPAPISERKKDGSWHIRYPQDIGRRVRRLLVKYDENPESVDLRYRWDHMKGKEQAEEILGAMPVAYLSDVDENEAKEYCRNDPIATRWLYDVLYPRVVEEGLVGALNIDVGIIPMVSYMMGKGVLVDMPYLQRLDEEFEWKYVDTLSTVHRLAGKYVNPNSSKQVVDALVDGYIMDEREESTAAEVLDKYNDHELVAGIQRCRQYKKLRSTYTKALIAQADDDSRVHTTYTTTFTETARLSSRDPNLQNIPMRTEEGRKVRKAFIAEPGRMLLALDYNQIEMRIAAHCSQDPEMMKVYRNGGDIHETTRKALFGGLSDDPHEARTQRRAAKVVNFGVIFGIGARSLYLNMVHDGVTEYSVDDCQGFIDDYPYTEYFQWVGKTKAEARRYYYVRNMFGRRRWMYEVCSTDKYVVEDGLRAAVNFPIQSAAGDILKIAMKRIWGIMPCLDVWPLLQVHDELVFSVAEDEVESMSGRLVPIMEGAVELTVPLLVEAKAGYNWNEMEAVN